MRRVIYITNMYIEEKENRLGMKEARIFITNQNKLIENAKVAQIIRPDPEVNLEQVKKEAFGESTSYKK